MRFPQAADRNYRIIVVRYVCCRFPSTPVFIRTTIVHKQSVPAKIVAALPLLLQTVTRQQWSDSRRQTRGKQYVPGVNKQPLFVMNINAQALAAASVTVLPQQEQYCCSRAEQAAAAAVRFCSSRSGVAAVLIGRFHEPIERRAVFMWRRVFTPRTLVRTIIVRQHTAAVHRGCYRQQRQQYSGSRRQPREQQRSCVPAPSG